MTKFFSLSLILCLTGTMLACKNSKKQAEQPPTPEDTTATTPSTPASTPPQSLYLAEFSWPGGDTYDFGEITEGETVEHTYTFVNMGQKPLFVSHVSASCGCTVPTRPQDSIAVGDEGEIVVKFNSQGRRGAQHKRITITANVSGGTTTLALKGVVKEKNYTICPTINEHFMLMSMSHPMLFILLEASGGGYAQFIVIGLIIFIFYFFMIRPQQKRQKAQRAFVDSVKRGDPIVTTGGIHGKISSVEKDGTCILEIDKGTKIKIEKSSISSESSRQRQTT